MKTSLNAKAIAAEDLLFNKLEVFDSVYQVYRPAVLKHLQWKHKSIQSSPASIVVNGTKVQRVLLEDIILTVAADDLQENQKIDERELASFSLSTTHTHEPTTGETREAGIRWSKETVSKLKPAAVPLDLIGPEPPLSEQHGRDFSATESRMLNLTSADCIVEGQYIDVLISDDEIPASNRFDDVETDRETPEKREAVLKSSGWRECLVVSVDGKKATVKSKDFPTHFAVPLNAHKIRLARPAVASFKQLFHDEACSLHVAKFPLPSLELIDRFLSQIETIAERSVANMLNHLWVEHGFFHAEVVVEKGEDCQDESYGVRVFGSLNSIRELSAQLASISARADPVVLGSSLERRCRRLKLLDVGGEADKSEFFVHESLVGLVIGKQGENIIRVARAYKVEVRVFPDECGVRRLRLYGSDHVRVALARNELEYQYFEVPFPAEVCVGISRWLSEERGLIQNLCHHTNVHSVWWNPKKSTLIVCGLRLNIRHFLFGLGRVHRETRSSITDGKESAELSDSPPTDVPTSNSIQESPFAFASPSGASTKKSTPQPDKMAQSKTGENPAPKSASANSRKTSQRASPPPAFQLFPRKATPSGGYQRGSRSSQGPRQDNSRVRPSDPRKAPHQPPWARDTVTEGDPFYGAQEESGYDPQLDPRLNNRNMAGFDPRLVDPRLVDQRLVDQRHLDQRQFSHRPPYGKLDFPSYVGAPGSPQLPVGPPIYYGEQWSDHGYGADGAQYWRPHGMVTAYRMDHPAYGQWMGDMPRFPSPGGEMAPLRCRPPADRAEYEAACYNGKLAQEVLPVNFPPGQYYADPTAMVAPYPSWTGGQPTTTSWRC